MTARVELNWRRSRRMSLVRRRTLFDRILGGARRGRDSLGRHCEVEDDLEDPVVISLFSEVVCAFSPRCMLCIP